MLKIETFAFSILNKLKTTGTPNDFQLSNGMDPSSRAPGGRNWTEIFKMSQPSIFIVARSIQPIAKTTIWTHRDRANFTDL